MRTTARARSPALLYSIYATITDVVVGDKGPPYAVCKAESMDRAITFTITRKSWLSKRLPVIGRNVWLSNIKPRKNGLRAAQARYAYH